LQRLSARKKLNIQKENRRKTLIDKLSSGTSYSEISQELKSIEISATITEKLLEMFPGWFGGFICLFFAQFLNETIVTDKQQIAYDKIVSFLDDLSPLIFPQDVQDYFIENTNWINSTVVTQIKS
jgi:hypothetical protein